jgi:hypothetical protein
MNLICFIQVSEFIFVLKINFPNCFSIFISLWTVRHLLRNTGSNSQFSPDSVQPAMDCELVF